MLLITVNCYWMNYSTVSVLYSSTFLSRKFSLVSQLDDSREMYDQ